MRYILVISSLVLSACGPGFKSYQDQRTIHGVDSTFEPYIAEYITYKGSPLSYDIPVQFANLSDNAAGLCTRWSSGERQIQVDRLYWENSLDEGEKLSLILHELGHCDLNRNHLETTGDNGWPVSIMYPNLFGVYPWSLQYYIEELFSPAPATSAPSLATKADCVHDIDVESAYAP